MFDKMKEDIACFKARDPACRSSLEVLLLYPGYKAIRKYRIAHRFYKKNMKFIARAIS